MDESELAGAVNTHVKVQFAFGCAHFGDVDMEVADGVGLELLLGFFVAGHFGQPADPMALQTPVQRRPRQLRDRGLQGVEAVVQRQQRVLAESDDASVLAIAPRWLRVFALFLNAERRRLGIFGAGREIAD